MIYLGSLPQPCPHDPTLVRCRIRNRHMSWVITDSQFSPAIRPFDLYLDRAGTVWAQNIMGRRRPLSEICLYAVRTLLTPERTLTP